MYSFCEYVSHLKLGLGMLTFCIISKILDFLRAAKIRQPKKMATAAVTPTAMPTTVKKKKKDNMVNHKR